MKRLVLICLLVVFITGCLPWVRTSGYHAEPTLNVSAELPYGWMRHNTTDYLFITRDGPMLQYIMVESIHVEDELKHTKKKFKKVVSGRTSTTDSTWLLSRCPPCGNGARMSLY